MQSDERHVDKGKLRGLAAVEGMLGGLGDLLEKLADVAERGGSVERDGSARGADGHERRFRVGFNVRTAAGESGEREMRVEPFGDVRADAAGNAEVSDVREPPVDVFDEPGGTIVVVEMPGLTRGDVRCDLRGDVLTVAGERDTKRYRAEVLLPRAAEEIASIASNNGVFEIRLAHAVPGGNETT
ncbi:MAG: Hsp20/alpha crystallin family protein [Planctomycetota bacterium]